MGIEDNFNKIGEIIDNFKKENKFIPSSIYKEYDKEYIKLKKVYARQESNQNFIRYNYYLRKAYESNINFNTKLQRSLLSVLAYLKMNVKSKEKFIYNIRVMIDSIEVQSYEDSSNILERLYSFLKYRDQNKELIKQDAYEIIYFYYKQIEKFAQFVHVLNKEENEKVDKIVSLLIEQFEDSYRVRKNLKVSSIIAGIIYKLTKSQSIYMIRFLYFSDNEEHIQNVSIKLRDTIQKMTFYSNQSLKIVKKIVGDDNDMGKKMITLKEIDVYMATYFKLLYSDKNTNSAWKKINEMKQYVVYKLFNEGVSISDKLMKMIIEEWNLLEAFNKISLLRGDIIRLSSSTETTWIKETFEDINRQFIKMEKLFKYEENKSNVTKLKNIDDSFVGLLVEYMLHDLLIFIKNNKEKILDKKQQDYEQIIKDVYESTDIVLSKKIENNKPDIDIDISNRTAILIKNAKLKSEEYKTIKEELYLVSKMLNYKSCYYLINFNKNIDNIKSLKSKFTEFEEDYNIDIKIVDIKDFYTNILKCLKEPKKKYNFSEEQLYKMFGY